MRLTIYCEVALGHQRVASFSCWKNHDASKQRLGYAETARQLQKRLERCHPDNVALVETELAAALRREGPTVFDWLVEIILAHCPGGEEQEDGVELMLP
jgi:hypothetical protein